MTTTTTTSPGLYREPVLLNRESHRGKRHKRSDDLGVTRELNAVFCAIGEFAEAAKEYVIAFVPASEAKDEQGRTELSPVLLLGLRDKENLFLRPDGRWDARYVPAAIRRLPFGYANTGDGQLSVMVDAASPAFSSSEGELLIGEDGEATPHLQEVIKFLDGFEAEMQRTRGLCRRLAELDLFKPVQIDVTLEDGSKLSAGGVQMIDEEKIRALPEAVVLELVRNGALGLVYAHVLSASNVQHMSERLARRLAAAKPAGAA